ncbi:PE family protein [Mycobacterium simiae]|uniref:PE family protein n=1 Tax=Mycobacterium simiae TaxID=1784 RepID=A0A5B1BJ55_MYCSI|nr:PE family protein [Mycobacterium simiae]KAA1248698.1 PE family protein [Mycobacterium simiae]
MSILATEPQKMLSAALSLQSLGVTMSARNAIAAASTMEVLPPAADEVSALTAMQFVAHATGYQAVFNQAIDIHEKLVSMLAACAESYATGEAINKADLA